MGQADSIARGYDGGGRLCDICSPKSSSRSEQNEADVLDLLDPIERQIQDSRDQFEGGMSVVEDDLEAPFAESSEAEPFDGESDLSDHVRSVETTNEDTDEEYTCNLPGCDERTFNTLYGLTSHQLEDHEVDDEESGNAPS